MMATTNTHPSIDTTAVSVFTPAGLPTVERMRERMAMQAAMRQTLIEYVRSQMDQKRHFYTISDNDKPALSQDGARNLCGLYEVRAGEAILEEKWFDDGHYHVRATIPLLTLASNVEVARGTGSCSTRESRYAWRWVWSNDVPNTLNKADLKSRKRGNSFQYRVPNDDIADLYNTVLKMAEKRAQTAAVLRLPGCTEVFAEPGAEQEEAEDEEMTEKKELLTLIGKWWRSLPPGGKGKACQAVFGTPDPKALPGLALDTLDAGYATIELASAAQVNWKSPTLSDDLAQLTTQSAEKAKSDLFDNGSPGTTPTPNPAPQPATVDTVTGEVIEGEAEDDPRQTSMLIDDPDRAAHLAADAALAPEED